MPTDTIANDEQTATQLTEGYERITNELSKAIIGQRKPIDQPEYFAVSIPEHEPFALPNRGALRRRYPGW